MSARILHTSDWHLGKKLFREERTEEHALFLEWLKETIQEEKIDLLIIAGDVFDVPTPPHHSLQQFNKFLHDVVHIGCEIFVIGGNHDSALLLEAAGPFYLEKKIIVDGKLRDNFKEHCHEYEFNGEKFLLQSLPYFRNFEIFDWIKKNLQNKIGIEERSEAITEILNLFFETSKNFVGPKILTSHHLFGSFMASGSEQSLNLSGLETIPLSLLEGKFDYVALGHIHKPQLLKNENPKVVYSGSPIPLRFSEKEKKKISIIEIEKGNLNYREKEIPIFRPLIQLKTNLHSWREEINKISYSSRLTPFLEVLIELEAPVMGLVDEIKKACDELGLRLLSFFPLYSQDNEIQEQINRQRINELTPADLFKLFYREKFSTELDEHNTEEARLLSDFKLIYEKAENSHED